MTNKHWGKNLLFFLASISMALVSCAKQEDIDNLQKQIDNLKSNDIASIQQQMSGIQLSLGNLQTVDTELRGYIRTLQDQESKLAQADEALEGSIASLKTELKGDISAAKSDALAQLETYKANVSSQLAALRASIDSLKSKDADLQTQITSLQSYIDGDLKSYIDNGDKSVKTWASASFATLTQYNATADLIADIQGEISSINDRLTVLEATPAGVTRKELDDVISALDADHQSKLSKAVSDCNEAIASAKEEITAAYTTAIANAIAASESSMRTWVNDQLSGYYTIAQADAKIAALKTNLESQLSTQKTQLQSLISNLESSLELKIKNNADDIEECRGLIADCNTLIGQNAQAISDNAAAIAQLRTNLGTTKTEITTAYQQAISTAIGTLDGQLRGEIATQVSSVNSRIDSEVSTINSKIDSLTSRVAACENDIQAMKSDIQALRDDVDELQEKVAAILSRIQSITYVPLYSDGKASVDYDYDGSIVPGTVVFDFEIRPASVATDLAQVWETALSMKAVYTITRSALDFVPLDVVSATAQNGILTVTASGSQLKEDFFLGRCSASASLSISDGNNEISSDYIPMIPVPKLVTFASPNFKSYCVSKFDTDGDGKISTIEAYQVTDIDCSGRSITDLTGIEAFTNLQYLNCSGNSLTKLDLHTLTNLQTLVCYNNKLEDINLDNCAALTTINIVDATTNAYSFSSDDQPRIVIKNYSQATTLKFSMNVIKKRIWVHASPSLTSVDLSDNSCAEIVVNNNSNMTSVKVPASLVNYFGYSCALQQIDFSNCPDLEYIQIYSNQLTSLDVSHNPKLHTIQAYDNQLTTLDISNNPEMKILKMANNQLSSINLLGNIKLEYIDLGNNDLSSINVRTLLNLQTLSVSNNTAITDINVSNNTALQTLNVYATSISTLDVSKNTALTSLVAKSTPIAVLDVSANTALESLNVSATSLAALDVSNNTSLKDLDISNTPFKASVPIGYNLSIGVVFYNSGSVVKVISKDETRISWGYYGTKTNANSTTNGAQNTDIIQSDSPAAKWCRAKGAAWYLPAKDELAAICNNKNVINTTMSNIGGTQFSTGGYWSSTEYSSDRAYGMTISKNTNDNYAKNNSAAYVRAVRAL